MNLIDTRFVAAGVAMLLTAGVALSFKPAPMPPDRCPNLERMMPAQFGGWRIDPSVVPIPPSPDVQADLNKIYDQIVSRTYINYRGERIMLVVAYGSQQTDTLKAHRQEVCYAAQGFLVTAVVPGVLELGQSVVPVTRMLAVAGARSEPVTYWFTMGDQVVMTRLQRLIVQLKYGLMGEIPDGVLVRVSSLSINATLAFQAHREFLEALIGAMEKADAARLLGGLLS